jgi:hypothetical protein
MFSQVVSKRKRKGGRNDRRKLGRKEGGNGRRERKEGKEGRTEGRRGGFQKIHPASARSCLLGTPQSMRPLLFTSWTSAHHF